MSVVLFCGPSLPPRAAAALLEGVQAQVFGPVSQGDVYRAARSRPRAIGIIDGYFARMPAVWHKEILWALSEGIHVLGASSMGALRAAELAAFGMVGVGRIFEAFHSGELEDDDEVTLIHGPEDADYMPLSEALVDIRATVARATDEGILNPPVAEALLQRAKATYYPERSYRGLIAASRGSDADADTRARLEALEAWLPAHRVEQKRIDAEALVAELRRLEVDAVEEKRVDFRFERTDAWVQVTRHHAPSAAPHAHLEGATSSSLEAVLDELRLLDGEQLRGALRGALGRYLARQRARAEGVTGSPELFGEAVNRFFWERGVLEPARIEAWITSRDLDLKRFTSFMQDQAQAYWTSVVLDTEARAELVDYLRTTDDYERVVRRAERKRAALAERHLPREGDCDELLRWFYVQQRGEHSPPVDLAAAAVEAGFRDEDALLEALRRERAFVEG